MSRRPLIPAAFAASVLLGAPAAPAADSPKAASATSVPALSPQHAAIFAKLQQLGPMDARFKLGAGPQLTASPGRKKQISCGVLFSPPTSNPNAVSRMLYYLNDTGHVLPPGVTIQWEVEGVPPSCCKGFTAKTNQVWQPSPPMTNFMYSTESELWPPQTWTRPCKAWVIMP